MLTPLGRGQAQLVTGPRGAGKSRCGMDAVLGQVPCCATATEAEAFIAAAAIGDSSREPASQHLACSQTSSRLLDSDDAPTRSIRAAASARARSLCGGQVLTTVQRRTFGFSTVGQPHDALQAGSGVRCVLALVGRDGDRLAAVEAELARSGASRYTTVVSAPSGPYSGVRT